MREVIEVLTSTKVTICSGLIGYIVYAITFYKLSEKANMDNSWFAFVPILQEILFFHMIDRSGWYVLLGFIAIIPIIGPIILIIAVIVFDVEYYKAFDTPTVWIVLSIILQPVALIYQFYMAFSDSVQYVSSNKYQIYCE